MAVTILEVKRESCPETRLIGKKYEGIGAVHIVNGMPERWIGMLFPADTEVPEGFEYADIEPLEFAVCYLYDKENSSEFYTMDTHNICLEELRAHNLKRKEDDWCFERHNCPRFTTPDEKGNVILDYAISIEN